MEKRSKTRGDEVRREILKMMWEVEGPVRSWEIAEKMGISVPSSTMHLLRLIKAGYVSTPQKGHYLLTVHGKEILGLPKVDRELVSRILSSVSSEKAFHFYKGTGEYLQVFANSLNDFREKIMAIDVKSVEFHVPRRDFELWFQSLGDFELAEKMGEIRQMSLSGEHLRKKVYETVRSRYEELKRLFQQHV
ncbi:MAG: winged helix-turn-helix transcriptional regulator [Candidatus Bathyarchaeota archaeon]|nr:MAG: winged helix-turn-helix transcriptional regulator [Candidatus Bathyarchaeota archaeon]